MSEKTKNIKIVAFVLVALFLVCQSGYTAGVSGVLNNTSIAEKETSFMELTNPLEKMNLRSRTGSIRVVGDRSDRAGKLYDGKGETNFSCNKPTEVTIDLGGQYMLGGVRFLPSDNGGKTKADRCIGTRFYLSKNNIDFLPVAVADPVDGGEYTTDYKEFIFKNSGEFRYARVEIPQNASVGEIEWLYYPNWRYRAGGLDMKVSATNIQKDFEGDVYTGVYNKNGVLVSFNKKEQSFKTEKDAEISVIHKGIKKNIGDSYRVSVWEKGGALATDKPLVFTYGEADAEFLVSNVFSDNMMLQRDKPVKVWGKAPRNAKITAKFEDKNGLVVKAEAEADRNSQWELDLGKFPKGNRWSLTIKCGKEEKTYNNITFGDVWLCIGQSNMEYFMLSGKDTELAVKSGIGVKNKNIRLLNLFGKGNNGAGAPVDSIPVAEGQEAWSVMDKDSANYCSAIGYYFARELEKASDVPIGIITVAVGDTEINRWLPNNFENKTFKGTDGDLFNNRVIPFERLNLCGILMYQGEADEYRTHLSAEEYGDAMSGLVNCYRVLWGEELPFYWTQLTRYGKKDASAIREGQRLALELVEKKANTGMVSLMDIYGEGSGKAGSCRDDIHPHQKKEVAERFALFAKRDVYGDNSVVTTGPICISAEIKDGAVELSFEATGDIRVMSVNKYADKIGKGWIKENKIDTESLQEFEIAGEDGIFFPAKAEIKGDKVIVWSDKVEEPFYLRYAWGGYPEMPNLTDQGGLPAPSFSIKINR